MILVLTWLKAIRGGGGIYRGGQLNQRSCCSQNHWSSNTTSRLFQRQFCVPASVCVPQVAETEDERAMQFSGTKTENLLLRNEFQPHVKEIGTYVVLVEGVLRETIV